jgi:DNA-directed RNA polymerase subunit F
MRKNFQIKLEPKAHAHLKFRAKQLGLTLGELIENLISLMEIRVEKACKILNIQEGLIDDVLLKIFLKDGLKIDKNDLKEELNKVRTVKPNGFKPEITV